MAEEELSFLEETSEGESPEPEAQEVAQEELAEEPAVLAEPEATDTGEIEDPESPEPQEATPPVAEKESAGTVPLTVVLDEREKRQRAEQELQELRNQQQQQQQREMAAQRAAQQPAPDWYDDPAKAAQHQTQQIQTHFLNTQLNQSQYMATRDFGKEAVAETEAFVLQNPHIAAQFRGHPSPWHAAVEYHQKQKLIAEIGDSPEAYKARLLEEVKAELLSQNPAQQKPTAPPLSMAAAPSTGKEAPISQGDSFDEMFPG